MIPKGFPRDSQILPKRGCPGTRRARRRRTDLLPDARVAGLSRFRSGEIKWHDGVTEGPSNHLLDSQIQCVNALAPFVDRPEALRQLFGSVLPIAEVCCSGRRPLSRRGRPRCIRMGRTGQPPGRVVRVDADPRCLYDFGRCPLRYRAHDSRTEIALIEWKYTERYRVESSRVARPG